MKEQDKDPVAQIKEGNPWYTWDQFAVHLGSVGRRTLVENRWRIFESAIARWMSLNSSGVERTPVRFLDIGCGDGVNLYGLSQIIATCEWEFLLFGIDYNPLRINRARDINGINGLMQGFIAQLPFSNETFDLILCNHVLEHIYEDEVALTELNRILRPKGFLILSVPNEGCLLAQLRNRFVQPQIGRTTDHVQFYTPAVLIERTMSAGFKTIQMWREGFFMPHLRLNNWLQEKTFGRVILNAFRALLPSQAAGLIGIFSKS